MSFERVRSTTPPRLLAASATAAAGTLLRGDPTLVATPERSPRRSTSFAPTTTRRASLDEAAMSPALARLGEEGRGGGGGGGGGVDPAMSPARRALGAALGAAGDDDDGGGGGGAGTPPVSAWDPAAWEAPAAADLSSAFAAGCAAARLPPRSISLARRLPSVLDMTGHGLGDALAGVLSEALESTPDRSLTAVLFRDNRLTDRGVARLLSALAFHAGLTSLDLSLNSVRGGGTDALLRVLAGARVRTLVLDSCALGDRCGAGLAAGLLAGGPRALGALETLSLQRNALDAGAGAALARLLADKRAGLTELDVSWNNIRLSGAVALAASLGRNARLEALDMGYNALGSEPAVAALAASLRVNSTLLHLSVTHNGISHRGAAALGAALADNHVLLGLHFEGNGGVVDPRGFVVRAPRGPGGGGGGDAAGHVGLFTRIVGMTGARDTDWVAASSSGVCWICNRWVEARLTWTPHVSGPGPGAGGTVTCHLSLDGYRAEEMRPVLGPDGDVAWYELYRVVPPSLGAVRYYFSVEGVRCTAQDAPRDGEPGTEFEVNVTNAVMRAGGVSNAKLRPVVALPRLKDATRRAAAPGATPVFTKADSVFRDSAEESPECLLAAFEGDWSHIRLPGVRRSSSLSFAGAAVVAGVRRTLLHHYGTLLRVFKAYARPFTVSWGSFLELMTDCGVASASGGGCAVDLSRLFTSVNFAHAGDGRGRLNPDRQLTRTQFLDAIVRVAGEAAGGKTGAEVPAPVVEAFVRERLAPSAKRMDASSVRVKLYTREVDAVLRSAIPDFETVFVMYASTHAATAALSRATLPDFLRFCGDVGALSMMSTTRDCERAFKLAQPVSPDELASDGHLTLSFAEWLEAACLLAVAAPLLPPAALAAGGLDMSAGDVSRLQGAHAAMDTAARLEVLVARCAALAARRRAV